MTRHYIGDIEEFPTEGATQVTVDGIDLAVFNVGGEVYALHDSCCHKHLPLHPIGDPVTGASGDAAPDGGPRRKGEINPEKGTVRCPWHFLEFDLETGRCTSLDDGVATFDVVREGDAVYVDL